jgi:cell division protein ZapA
MEGNKVRTEIFGSAYNIQGDADPEYIYELADYVNEKMNNVSQAMSSSDPLQIAILAALNIADEYFQLKNIDSRTVNDIEKKTNALISMLEEGLIGDILSNKFTIENDLSGTLNQ